MTASNYMPVSNVLFYLDNHLTQMVVSSPLAALYRSMCPPPLLVLSSILLHEGARHERQARLWQTVEGVP